MIRSIWNSRSGMSAQMEKLNAVSNNISNVNTVGYRRVDVTFSNLMQESLDRIGYPVNGDGGNNALATGTGVKSSELKMDYSQGSLIQTEDNLDLAIDGKGMFKVIDSNGNEAFTRGGSFGIDRDGTIVDDNGNKLVILNEYGENVNAAGAGFIKEAFAVNEEGELQGDNYTGFRIPIYQTVGDNSMKSIGKNLYSPELLMNENGEMQRAAVIESENTNILQGFIENSNVDLGKEMADMIITQRAFQLNSTALKTADEMWQIANNLRGR